MAFRIPLHELITGLDSLCDIFAKAGGTFPIFENISITLAENDCLMFNFCPLFVFINKRAG